MRSLKAYSIILATVLFIFFAVIYSPIVEKYKNEKDPSKKNLEITDLQLAESYYRKGEYEHALDLISRHQDSLMSESEIGNEWLNLLVKVSEKSFDIPQLTLIHEFHPKALKNHEKASLMVAENYMINGKNDAYQTIRNEWIGREINKNKWALLDADHLLLQGHYQEGTKILETKLRGKDEISRLIRLSLLNAMENPNVALSYLREAKKIEPSDIDVFLYETRLLEKIGKKDEALKAYHEAIQSNPRSIFMKDQLAEYYIRANQYKEARETFKLALKSPSNEEGYLQSDIFVKLNFFDRMIDGKSNKWTFGSDTNPLIEYVSNLKSDTFKNNEAFSKLSHLIDPEKDSVIYWLELLSFLKNQQLDQALNLIVNHPFKENSFNPALEYAILQTLNLKKTSEPLPIKYVGHIPKNRPLFNALNQGVIHENEMAILKSEEAFTALLLEAGWTNAALNLHQLEKIPDYLPKEYTYDLAIAFRTIKGDEKALEFLGKQTLEDPKLHILTQEITAKLALKNGNFDLASRIYEALNESSFEAKSFLARKAFKENNYELAEKLTKELLATYPDHELLIQNLKVIQSKLQS